MKYKNRIFFTNQILILDITSLLFSEQVFVYYNRIIQLYELSLVSDYLSVNVNHTSGSITMN